MIKSATDIISVGDLQSFCNTLENDGWVIKQIIPISTEKYNKGTSTHYDHAKFIVISEYHYD